jgi:hypothetical protein
MRIFDLHTSKARYELKMVLLHLWRVNVKTIGGFINIPLVDLSHINMRYNNIRYCIGRPRQYISNRERTEDVMHAEQRGILYKNLDMHLQKG